jgi:hypothetical protein
MSMEKPTPSPNTSDPLLAASLQRLQHSKEIWVKGVLGAESLPEALLRPLQAGPAEAVLEDYALTHLGLSSPSELNDPDKAALTRFCTTALVHAEYLQSVRGMDATALHQAIKERSPDLVRDMLDRMYLAASLLDKRKKGGRHVTPLERLEKDWGRFTTQQLLDMDEAICRWGYFDAAFGDRLASCRDAVKAGESRHGSTWAKVWHGQLREYQLLADRRYHPKILTTLLRRDQDRIGGALKMRPGSIKLGYRLLIIGSWLSGLGKWVSFSVLRFSKVSRKREAMRHQLCNRRDTAGARPLTPKRS